MEHHTLGLEVISCSLQVTAEQSARSSMLGRQCLLQLLTRQKHAWLSLPSMAVYAFGLVNKLLNVACKAEIAVHWQVQANTW